MRGAMGGGDCGDGVSSIANEANFEWWTNFSVDFFCRFTQYTSQNSASPKSYLWDHSTHTHTKCSAFASIQVFVVKKKPNTVTPASPKYDILFDIQMRLFWGILRDRTFELLLQKTVNLISFYAHVSVASFWNLAPLPKHVI